MISKQRIFSIWLMYQLGNVLSVFFGMTINIILANALFSGAFMIVLIIAPKDKQ